MGGPGPGVGDALALRLVAAYGLRDGALAPLPPPPERPPYVPYCEDVGTVEIRRASHEAVMEASRLWHEGLPIKAVARGAGLTYHQVAGLACRHRDKFPRRRRRRG